MIVDASALLAILLNEREARRFSEALAGVAIPLMSVANFLEVAIRVDRAPEPLLIRKFEALMELTQIRLEPVSLHQARIARRAYVEFGRGRHRAGLNFGDCFAYALAKETGLPLLFKGDDFAHTDLKSAL